MANVLFFITSLVEPKNKYFSVFNHTERYNQTIKTIESIKKYVPTALIVVVEASYTSKFTFGEVLVFNIEKNEEIYGHKSIGESLIIEQFLNSEYYKNLNSIDIVFKISGRYYLNDKFNINSHDLSKINCCIVDTKNDPNNNFKHSGPPDDVSVTSLFSFPYNKSDYILQRLKFVIENIKNHGGDIEHYIFKNEEVNKINVIGISGTQTGGKFVMY